MFAATAAAISSPKPANSPARTSRVVVKTPSKPIDWNQRHSV